MFSKALLIAACAAFAAAQSAVLTFSHVPNPMTDGEAQAILFQTNDTETPATIVLKKGPSNNLQTVETLTQNALDGQFIWTPPLSIPDGTNYALYIQQGSQHNYFGPFQIQGANPKAVSSASAAAASSTSSSSTHSKNATATSSSMSASNSTMSHNSTMSSNSTTTTATTHHTTTATHHTTTTAVSHTTKVAPSTAASSAPTPQSTGNSATTVYTSYGLSLGALAAFVYLL